MTDIMLAEPEVVDSTVVDDDTTHEIIMPTKSKVLTFLERTATFFKRVGESTIVKKVAKTWHRYTVKGKHRRRKTESVYAKSTVTDGIVVQTPRRRTPASFLRSHQARRTVARTGAKEPARSEPAIGVVPSAFVNTYGLHKAIEDYLRVAALLNELQHPDPSELLPAIPRDREELVTVT